MNATEPKPGQKLWLVTGADAFQRVQFHSFLPALDAVKVFKKGMKTGHDWRVRKSELRTREQMGAWFNWKYPGFVEAVKINKMRPRTVPNAPAGTVFRDSKKTLLEKLNLSAESYAALIKKAREYGLLPLP